MDGWCRNRPPAALILRADHCPKTPIHPGACQAAALLETVHVLAGLVKGSAPLALLQWFGRSNVLFLILGAVPEVSVQGKKGWWRGDRVDFFFSPTTHHPPLTQVQKHAAVLPLFLAWSIADIIRYAWYAAGPRAPHWLTWLRYSAFIPLYPIGIFAGEMPIIRAAIPYIAKRGLWSITMPNAWNYAFSYAAFCRVGLYFLLPAAFLHLYGTLLAARRRKLGGGERKRD